MRPDDQRLADASRALRRRQGIRQIDLAAVTRRSRRIVLRLEGGDAGTLRLNDLRDHFTRLGARVRLSVWWNGAALDHLLDERHAALVEASIAVLRANTWRTEAEVTFSEYGERGSIDVLAGHEATRSLFVGEIKTAWGSLEETNRRLDVKERLGPKFALERFGWRPAAVARVLILPDDRSLRRVVERHALTLESVYPARSRAVRAWVRRPAGPLRGMWFLADGSGS